MSIANFYRVALLVHIAAGIIGLAAFWTPAFARKGGTLHVRAGRIFYRCTSLVACTGLVMAALLLIDPLGVKLPGRTFTASRAAEIASGIRLFVPFLAYLVLITFTPVHHGVRVLATRHEPTRLRTSFHTALNVTTIASAAALVGLGLFFRQPIFVALSPIGFLIGVGGLQFARRPYPTRMAWWYEHMGSMLGGGIAFHTAFLVLGMGRFLHLDGLAAVIPWILPTVVGIPASATWTRYYRRKFETSMPSLAGRSTYLGQASGVD